MIQLHIYPPQLENLTTPMTSLDRFKLFLPDVVSLKFLNLTGAELVQSNHKAQK